MVLADIDARWRSEDQPQAELPGGCVRLAAASTDARAGNGFDRDLVAPHMQTRGGRSVTRTAVGPDRPEPPGLLVQEPCPADGSGGLPDPPDLVLTGNGRVVLVNGRPVRLSRGEARLLAALAQCPGLPVHRCVLGYAAWPSGTSGSSARVSVAVQRLRRKIGHHRVLTVYGQGYRLLPVRMTDQRRATGPHA